LALAAALAPASLAAADAVQETVFVNKTPWQVHIVAGSGRIDVCDIPPRGQVSVKTLPDRDETYYPVFDVPLTEFFTVKNLRAAERDFYFRLDGSRQNRRVEITAPEAFNDSRAYLALTNASKAGGNFRFAKRFALQDDPPLIGGQHGQRERRRNRRVRRQPRRVCLVYRQAPKHIERPGLVPGRRGVPLRV
jgi:hypothetical protein